MLIAQGSQLWEIGGLGRYDNQFAEGDTYELLIRFRVPLAANLASSVSGAISPYVAEPYTVRQSGNDIVLRAQKGNPFPWAVLIIIPILAALAVFLVFWQLSRIPAKTIEVAGEAIDMIKVGAVVLGVWWVTKQIQARRR